MGQSRWGLIGGLVTRGSDSRAQRPTARPLDRGLIRLEGVLLPPRRGLIRLEGQLMRLQEQLIRLVPGPRSPRNVSAGPRA